MITFIKKLIQRFISFESGQRQISSLLLGILNLQYCLINISYIQLDSDQMGMFPHIRILQFIGRPQLIVQIDGMDYFIALVSLIYCLGIFWRFTGWQYCAIYSSLLDLSLLNFAIEQNMTILQFACSIILILITLSRTFLSRNRYDMNQINTDYIENNCFLILFRFITLLQLIMNQLDKQATYVITLFNCVLYGYIIIKYKILDLSNLKEIGFCIQIASFYYALLIILHAENSFTADIIFLPFIFKIGSSFAKWIDFSDLKLEITSQQLSNSYYKVLRCQNRHIIKNDSKAIHIVNIKQLKPEQQIIQASTQIALQPLEALKLLFKIQKTSENDFITKIKINLLIQKSFLSLKQLIESKTITQIQSNEFVDVLKREQLQQEIYIETCAILRTKIELIINYNTEIRTKQYYTKSMHAISQILLMRDKLAQNYKQFTSHSNQAVYIFYLVEILNDIITASEVASFGTSLTDNYSKKENLQTSTAASYMITEYKQDLIIKSVSAKFAEQMQKTAQQLIGQNMLEYVPTGIREHHNYLVDQFLITGQSKYYKNTDNVVIQYSDLACVAYEFSFDICFTKNSIQFIAVLQQDFEQPYFLIVDSKGRISAQSKTLQLYFQNGIDSNSIINDNIQDIIPNILELRHSDMQFQEIIIQIGNQSISATLSIKDRIIDDQIVYSMITFNYLRRLSHQSQTVEDKMNQSIQNSEFLSQINEDAIIDIPKDNIYSQQQTDQDPLKTNQLTNLNQLESNRISQEDILLSSRQQQQRIFYDNQGAVQEDRQSISEIKQQESGKIKNHIDDRSSMMSSYQTMKSSIFYKKYQIVQRINNLSGQSKFHTLHYAFLVLCIMSSLILAIVQLTSLNKNLTSLVSDIDLLQIKNIATQPIESFQVTRYTILNDNQILAAKVINETQYNKLVAYPRSNLKDGFILQYQNLKTVMDRKELQTDLQALGQYSIFKQPLGRNIETITISLRTFLDMLLSYQDISMMAYVIDGNIVSDSPHVMFQFKNYHQMKSKFQTINRDIYLKTLQTTSQVQWFTNLILILTIIILLLLLTIAIFYRQVIISNCDKYYQVYSQAYEFDISNEVKRLKLILEKMVHDEKHIFYYKFQVGQLEKTLDRRQNNLDSRKINTITRQFTKLTLLPFILLLLFVISDSLATYFQSNAFLQKYPETAHLYWQMSDVGTDVPTMYVQREALYIRANYPFLNETDLDNIYIEVMSALRRTQEFISSEYSSNLVTSDSFMKSLTSYDQESLCPYIPTNNDFNDTLALCNSVLNGNIQNGLKQLLNYLANQIETDSQLNNFTAKTYNNFLEFEGIYMTSQFIRGINNQFRTDLLKQTNILITQIQAYNIVYFIIMMILLIFGFIYYVKALIKHYHNCQRLILLLPRNTIFLDDQFERNINMRIIYDVLN